MLLLKLVGNDNCSCYAVSKPTNTIRMHVRLMCEKLYGSKGTRCTWWTLHRKDSLGQLTPLDPNQRFHSAGLASGDAIFIRRSGGPRAPGQAKEGRECALATSVPGGNSAKTKIYHFPNAGALELSQSWRRGGAGTGSVAWDASFVLAAYLDAHAPQLKRFDSVLELGAGTGLPSIVAAITGAPGRFVLATDGDEQVLPILSSNLSSAPPHAARAQAMLFRWGCSDDSAEVSRVLKSRASRSSSAGSPVLILAADLLYRGSQSGWDGLIDALASFLRPSGSLCLMAITRREGELGEKFLSRLQEHRLAYEKLQNVRLGSRLPQESLLYGIALQHANPIDASLPHSVTREPSL
ncbi:Protein N-methyltransferase nnt1 [Diplonema papillatum]|nr:Protein N-methyltransferase nnt1 [Diplonema papillatum]